jgi:hypothetical protein
LLAGGCQMSGKLTKCLSIGAAAALLVSLTACAGGEPRGKRGMSNYGARESVYDTHNYGSQKGTGGALDKSTRLYGYSKGDAAHRNTRLVYSQTLSDAVTGMPGVNTAFVMLTDRNAYAAILIDNTATGTKSYKRETNNSGTSVGRYYPHSFHSQADRRKVATGSSSYETVEHTENLSHGFKHAIAANIRQHHPAVTDVYISANRDFVNQLNVYAQESWSGRPIDRHLAEFNQSALRLFGSSPE